MALAHLFRVIVPVSGLPEAVEFYDAILGSPGTRVSPGRHYFDCDGVILACFDPRADGEGRDTRPLPEPIYLAVDDLAATRRACADAGAAFPTDAPPGVGPLGEIRRRPWGEESFYVGDPFGNRLCFVTRATAFTG